MFSSLSRCFKVCDVYVLFVKHLGWVPEPILLYIKKIFALLYNLAAIQVFIFECIGSSINFVLLIVLNQQNM